MQSLSTLETSLYPVVLFVFIILLVITVFHIIQLFKKTATPPTIIETSSMSEYDTTLPIGARIVQGCPLESMFPYEDFDRKLDGRLVRKLLESSEY